MMIRRALTSAAAVGRRTYWCRTPDSFPFSHSSSLSALSSPAPPFITAVRRHHALARRGSGWRAWVWVWGMVRSVWRAVATCRRVTTVTHTPWGSCPLSCSSLRPRAADGGDGTTRTPPARHTAHTAHPAGTPLLCAARTPTLPPPPTRVQACNPPRRPRRRWWAALRRYVFQVFLSPPPLCLLYDFGVLLCAARAVGAHPNTRAHTHMHTACRAVCYFVCRVCCTCAHGVQRPLLHFLLLPPAMPCHAPRIHTHAPMPTPPQPSPPPLPPPPMHTGDWRRRGRGV